MYFQSCLKLNLAHYQYRSVAVQVNREGELNPSELAIIHNNSKIYLSPEISAMLLKACMFRRQLIKKNFWLSCENIKENYSCMFCVTVFLQINIKKNTNSSLKRPQDKGTKAGSVKKEKVVKKEEGNYVVKFCTAVISYTNKLKMFAFKLYYECTS